MDQQRLTVKSLTGTTFLVTVDILRTTVGDVKAQVAHRQGGLPAPQQRLIFCGQELEDQHALAHYGIANETCLHVVERDGGDGGEELGAALTLPAATDGAAPIGETEEDAAQRAATAALQDEVLAKSLEIEALKRELRRQRTAAKVRRGAPDLEKQREAEEHELRARALTDRAARIAAAEVEKQRLALVQAVDHDRIAAEELGWVQGLAPEHVRPYYFHPERPTEVFYSVDDLRSLARDRARATAQAWREAELQKHAAECGALYADIERCVDARAAQTLEEVRARAQALADANASVCGGCPEADRLEQEAQLARAEATAASSPQVQARSPEADGLEQQAATTREAAAAARAKAREAAKAGDFGAAKALKAEAVDADARARDLDDQAIEVRVGAAERTRRDAAARAEAAAALDEEALRLRSSAKAEAARVAAARDQFHLPATLERRCAEEVARLQRARDASIEGDDYELAGQLDAKAKAYAALGQKLHALSWMQWRAQEEQAAEAAAEAAATAAALREREADVAGLREELARTRARAEAAEAELRAEAKLRAEAAEAKHRAEAKARAEAEARVRTTTLLSTWAGGAVINFQLVELKLPGRGVRGPIPTEIGQLAQLTTLWLQGNQLTGRIPTEIGQLAQLEELFLHRNQLTGRIPTEFGQLVQLTHLFLNENQLTGRIPTQIGQLAQLKHLRLYSNQLTGTGEFKTFMKSKVPACSVYV